MYVDDETRLLIMRDAAREALGFLEGQTGETFDADPVRQDAVAWRLTTLGSAAAKLTPAARSSLGDALSSDVLGVYDRLEGGDYETTPAALWIAVTEGLPPLLPALERALATPALVHANGLADRHAPSPRLAISRAAIASYCGRHRIRKLALFGSVLREDFRPDSDVDVLVEFEPGVRVSLFDMVHLQDELAEIIGHQADLQTAGDLSPYFRDRVVASAEVVYERG